MQDQLWEVMSKLADYKARRETSKFHLSVADLLALDQEIERLEGRQRELMAGADTAGRTGTRSDSMSAEIEAALRELGDHPTPDDVMRKLKEFAGKPGSCITSPAPDGVLWRSQSGQSEKLTKQALKKRLSRQARPGR